MLGIQIPILLAIFEYGVLLTMKRVCKKEPAASEQNKIQIIYSGHRTEIKPPKKIWDLDKLGKTMDKWAFTISLSFMIIFNVVYWSVAQA